MQYFLLGAYVSLTMDGKIVVGGVLASCYADFNHDLAHLTMTPVQWFPDIIRWIFGDDSGFQVFVNMAREFGMMMLPHGQYSS